MADEKAVKPADDKAPVNSTLASRAAARRPKAKAVQSAENKSAARKADSK